MDEEILKLQKIASYFKNMSYKVKLISLITKAKKEYDSYDFISAKQTLLEAFKLNPKNSAILRGLGCVYQFNNNFTKAILYYKRALKFSTAKEIEYTLLGTAYYLQDKFEEAIKYFNQAIASNDDYEVAYKGRNQAMLEKHVMLLDLQETLEKYFFK